jgi:hypothetical protein
MGRPFSRYEEEEEIQKERNHQEDPDVVGRLILKRFLDSQACYGLVRSG